ncbi:MAG: polysaccharide biosynthesis protein [Bacilli bacterium]|nr:polysaccharide biosynthesis protein [Bacilli bacterium]
MNKKRQKILVFIIMDILVLTLCSFLAIGLRFDFTNVPSIYINNIQNYLLVDIAILLALFIINRLYVSVWSFASISELINVFLSCISFIALEFMYKVLLLEIRLPRSYYIIKVVLLVLFVSAVRYAYRIARTIQLNARNKKELINTMIIGAGEAGRLLITEINNNPTNFGNRIMCVIDDDKNKEASYIRNIPIIGNRTKITEACKKYKIEEIIIAIPSATKEKISLIVDECQKNKVNIRILPNVSEMIGKPSMNKVRPLAYEDFLGRDQIIVDVEEISTNITDRTILVTGGGGSIGSELCRQIAKCEPRKLIIFDIYENNAYDIQQELIRTYPKLDLEVIIGSVRDYDRLETVFHKYRPEQVFHAAAHKHVPLMEVSPNEAIKNNCLGTLNMAKLANIYKVKKFVLVSTDKAVRPTNVMGATKRICEMIVQTYDKMSDTDYVAVRFGNVLGSNGSVIPLFLKQIENGGPVTVTHKDITRFFMTIPEAVSLILQASVYAEGGEIFVLDMGTPVKIYDLAKKIIRFKGYEPNVDIKIKVTGLRPGEKLYEELLMDEEGLKETPNKLIHIGQPIKLNEKKFLKDLDKLIESAYKNKNDIKEKVAKIVDTYTIDKGEK